MISYCHKQRDMVKRIADELKVSFLPTLLQVTFHTKEECFEMQRVFLNILIIDIHCCNNGNNQTNRLKGVCNPGAVHMPL